MSMKAEVGQALWLLLHEWARQLPLKRSAEDRAKAEGYLMSWRELVLAHSAGCDCGQFLTDFIQHTPVPVERGHAAIMSWTIDLHNAVNTKLGKPLFTLAMQSKGRWVQLHEYAWQYPSQPSADDWQPAREWYASWRVKHFCGTCGHRIDWLPHTLPDTLNSAAEFYWWTVALHDRWNYIHGRSLHAAEWSSRQPVFSDLPLRNFLQR